MDWSVLSFILLRLLLPFYEAKNSLYAVIWYAILLTSIFILFSKLYVIPNHIAPSHTMRLIFDTGHHSTSSVLYCNALCVLFGATYLYFKKNSNDYIPIFVYCMLRFRVSIKYYLMIKIECGSIAWFDIPSSGSRWRCTLSIKYITFIILCQSLS